jgi:nitrogen fixation NifU-like protein
LTRLTSGKTSAEFAELLDNFKELMNSRGQGIDEQKMQKLDDAAVFLGTSKFPARIKCAMLPWMALSAVRTIHEAKQTGFQG